MTVDTIDADDAVTFKIAHGRVIAWMFLDYLLAGPDSLDSQSVLLCRYRGDLDQWRPAQVEHGPIVDEFIAWVQES